MQQPAIYLAILAVSLATIISIVHPRAGRKDMRFHLEIHALASAVQNLQSASQVAAALSETLSSAPCEHMRTLSVACEQPSVHGFMIFMDSNSNSIPPKTPHVLWTYHQKKSGDGWDGGRGYGCRVGLGRSCTGGQQRSDLDPPMDHAVGHANGLGACHLGGNGPVSNHSNKESHSMEPTKTNKQKLGCAPCLGTGDIKRSQETKENKSDGTKCKTNEIARRERGRSADRRGISQDLYLAVMTCLESRDKSNATSKSHLLGPFDKHWLSPSKLNVPQLHD